MVLLCLLKTFICSLLSNPIIVPWFCMQVVASYFPLHQCIEGLKVVVESLFGATFRSIPLAPGESWHPDVLKMSLHHPEEVHIYWKNRKCIALVDMQKVYIYSDLVAYLKTRGSLKLETISFIFPHFYLLSGLYIVPTLSTWFFLGFLRFFYR